MKKLIRIDSVVIVEGKYDKITLENIIDATIVTTDGFGIYRNRNKRELIRVLCEKNGAVIITDSDSAGMQIRSFIKSFCDSERIVNVYLPQIVGKEKRKATPSKQGFLGLEGMDADVILSALEKSGIIAKSVQKTDRITKTDLYRAGLSGKTDSSLDRARFMKFVGLPTGLSSNAFLDALNSLFTVETFNLEVEKWRLQQAKN